MVDFIVKGGWVMYPLLLSSIIALSVIIERLWFLRRKKVLIPEIISVLDQINSPEDLNLAKSICRKRESTFSKIVLTSLDNQDLPPDELRVLVEDEGRQRVRTLERGLITLETVAAVAPLLGLLGTVFGMIKVFNVIQTLGVGQAKALSGGISEADGQASGTFRGENRSSEGASGPACRHYVVDAKRLTDAGPVGTLAARPPQKAEICRITAPEIPISIDNCTRNALRSTITAPATAPETP